MTNIVTKEEVGIVENGIEEVANETINILDENINEREFKKSDGSSEKRCINIHSNILLTPSTSSTPSTSKIVKQSQNRFVSPSFVDQVFFWPEEWPEKKDSPVTGERWLQYHEDKLEQPKLVSSGNRVWNKF